MSAIAIGGPSEPEIDQWSRLVFAMRTARMPLRATGQLVKAFAHGVIKHGAGNYWAVYANNRDEPMRKVMRHINACFDAKDWGAVDDESGVPHLAKAAANCLIALAVNAGD